MFFDMRPVQGILYFEDCLSPSAQGHLFRTNFLLICGRNTSKVWFKTERVRLLVIVDTALPSAVVTNCMTVLNELGAVMILQRHRNRPPDVSARWVLDTGQATYPKPEQYFGTSKLKLKSL